MNTGPSASRTIPAHHAQLPLIDLTSGAQGLPVASTLTFQSGPIRCPTVASQPHWSTSCPGSTSQSCMLHTPYRSQKDEGSGLEIPSAWCRESPKTAAPSIMTLPASSVPIVGGFSLLLTSRPFPGHPLDGHPPPFPRGLYESCLTSSAPPYPPDLPFPELL